MSTQSGMIPPELRALRQWVVWKTVYRDARPTKVLYNPLTGGPARTHNTEGKTYADQPEDTWASFQEALKAARVARWDGIGFVFTAADPYVGIDLDETRDNGRFTDEARRIIVLLDSYSEISPSGHGVHIIVRGKLPPGGRRKGHVEMYDCARYFTMTGNVVEGHGEIHDRQEQLQTLHDSIFCDATPPTTAPVRPVLAHLSLSDAELLEKARASRNGGKFVALYDRGDVSIFDGDDSRADLALAGMLAFWAQGDETMIDRLFRGSALFRPKWDRDDYSRRTIARALSGKTEFYTPNTNGSGTTAARIALPTSPGTSPTEPASAGGAYNLTEFGDAERLVAGHGEGMRYCEEADAWYVWDGCRWVPDSTGKVIEASKATIRSLYSEAMTIGDEKRRAELVKHALRGERASHARNMEFLARVEPGMPVKRNVFDQDPMLLNCANGTINLKNGVLLPPRREDYITMTAGCEYDPAAEAPTWMRFLTRIVPDPDVRTFLQRSCGYALTGDVSEQCFFFLHGSGANGKSTMINALLAVLGDYGLQAVSDLLLAKKTDRVPADVAELNKRRFVATIEIDDGRRMAEGLVKQMTGGEDMRARFLYQGFFQFTPTHKVFMAANHKPVIRGTDMAIWRRVMLVPFLETITDAEKDIHLGQKLKAEGPGVLRWCVEGCLDWQAHGLQAPPAVRAAIDNYRAEQDIIGQYLETRCIRRSGISVNATRLYQDYHSWCLKSGEQPLTATAFGRELTSRGHDGLRKGGQVLRVGIDIQGEGLDV